VGTDGRERGLLLGGVHGEAGGANRRVLVVTKEKRNKIEEKECAKGDALDAQVQGVAVVV
jgi:hypothetical protein